MSLLDAYRNTACYLAVTTYAYVYLLVKPWLG